MGCRFILNVGSDNPLDLNKMAAVVDADDDAFCGRRLPQLHDLAGFEVVHFTRGSITISFSMRRNSGQNSGNCPGAVKRSARAFFAIQMPAACSRFA
jgi:hypothetical protein